jgi:hypothetical protein
LSNLTIIKKSLFHKEASTSALITEPGNAFNYNDDEVSALPDISPSHPEYKKWNLAKEYCKRLTAYILQKGNVINILVTGCANGWLAAQLSKHTTGLVIGVDDDEQLLQQAKRVFSKIENLQFDKGNIDNASIEQKKFDIIVLSKFSGEKNNISGLIKKALLKSSLAGEVHIIAASDHQPQLLKNIAAFQYKILHRPTYSFCGYSFIKDPFYHIIVKNPYL